MESAGGRSYGLHHRFEKRCRCLPELYYITPFQCCQCLREFWGQFAKTSQRLGIGVEALGIKFAAEQCGGGIEELEDGLKNFIYPMEFTGLTDFKSPCAM